MSKIIEKLKKRFRYTIIHGIYAIIKYEMPIVFKYKIYYNIKKGKNKKVSRFISNRIKRTAVDLPKAVAIDIVSCCNLRCPLCSVPPFLTKKDENFMPLEQFKKIVDGIDITTDLSLVYAGEPLLHPSFLEMVDYCSDRYFTTTITNGTLLKGRLADALIVNGLDFLQISFDGFSKESFEKYRVGANFDSVKRNIVDFLRKRAAFNTGLPHVTVTYLVNAYNEHEVKQCEYFCLSQGSERFFAKAINLNVHRRDDGAKEEDLSHWLPKKDNISLYNNKEDEIKFKERYGRCSICDTPIIRCDGEILLCCHDIFNKIKIGNVHNASFKDIWCSNQYIKIRKLARERKLPVCQLCGK